MNRSEKYVCIKGELVKSVAFWTNLLFVLFGSLFIPKVGFFTILVAIGFNILRGELKWGSDKSIKHSTAGYIAGLFLFFVVLFVMGVCGR